MKKVDKERREQGEERINIHFRISFLTTLTVLRLVGVCAGTGYEVCSRRHKAIRAWNIIFLGEGGEITVYISYNLYLL